MSIISDIVYGQTNLEDAIEDEYGVKQENGGEDETAMINQIGAYANGVGDVIRSNKEDNGVVPPWSGSMTTATETPGLASMKKYEPTYVIPGGYVTNPFSGQYVTLDYSATTDVEISPEAFNVTTSQVQQGGYVAAPELNEIILVQLMATSNADDKYIALKCTTVGNVATSTEEGGSQAANDYVFSYVASSSNLPVCLTDTCDILTPNGYVNVKDLSLGDLVTTPEGKNVKITKVMKPITHVAMGKALPHFIPKNSLGENKPSKDTFISKNHAYKTGDEWLCGQFNIGHNATNWDKDFVTYYNIMTEDYPKHSLVVNGVEMESWGGYEHNKPETHVNIKLRKEKIGFK